MDGVVVEAGTVEDVCCCECFQFWAQGGVAAFSFKRSDEVRAKLQLFNATIAGLTLDIT